MTLQSITLLMALKSKGNETMETRKLFAQHHAQCEFGRRIGGQNCPDWVKESPRLLWLALHNTDSLVDTRHVTSVFRRNQKGRSASAPQPRIPFPITSEERA